MAGRAVGVLLGLVVAVLGWALYTDSGRSSLRRIALQVANDIIAGELRVERLETIGPAGITCSGIRLLDPQGEQVAALDRLAVELSPGELLDSHVLIPRARLEGLRVDLRHLDEVDRGLLAAVQTEPSEPDPDGEPSSWVVDVRRVELADGEIVAELAPWGEVTVRDLAATAQVHVGETLAVELEQLSLDLHEDEERLAELREVRGSYRTDGQPSALALRLKAGGATLDLEASGVAPPADGWDGEPLQLKLDLISVGPELWRLARVEPPEQLRHPLGVAVTLTGTPADVRGKLVIASPGGKIRATLRLEERDALSVAVHARDLDVQRIWSDAPAVAARTSADLQLKTRLAQAPTTLPFRVELRQASLSEIELPEVELAGRLDEERVRDLSVKAKGYGGELVIRGEAGLDGSVEAEWKLRVPSIERPLRLAGVPNARGQVEMAGKVGLVDRSIDARARADVRRLQVAELRLDEASLDVTARGPLAEPVITATVRTGAGRFESTSLEPSTLRVSGGPDDYRLSIDAGVAGNRAAVEAEASLEPDGVTVSARGSGQLLGQPLHVDVRRARVGFDGQVQLGALELGALGQKLTATGALRGSRREQLVIETHDVDLQAVSRTLGLEPPLRGHVDVRLAVSGTAAKPLINLSGTARQVHLPAPAGAHAGTASGSWQATLDAQQGWLDGEARITTEREDTAGPTVELKLAGSFPTRGTWTQKLLEGEDYRARLRVERLALSFLEPWLGAPLPVEGSVSATVEVAGRVLQPTIELSARGDLEHPDSGEPLQLDLEARHDGGRLDVTLGADDQQGDWADLALEAQMPDEPLPELLARAARLGDESSWTVHVGAQNRELGSLPIAIDWPEQLEPLRFSLRATASHEPRAEPRVAGTVQVSYPAVEPSAERKASAAPTLDRHASCRPRSFRARLKVDLEEGELDAELRAGAANRRWVDLAGEARLALAPLLRGEAAQLPRDVGLRLDLDRIDAAELPVICESAVGTVTGHGSARDLLGEHPHAKLDLVLAGVGTRETLDGRLAAELDEHHTRLDVELNHRDRANRVRARLPLSLSNGRPAMDETGPVKATVHLGGLPLAAVVPTRGPLSRLSGEITGKVTAAGTFDDPRVRGAIDLHDVGLTLTAVAQPLRRIDGRVAFDNDRVIVRDLVARDQEGTMTLNGEIDVGDLPDRAALRFGVKAEDFPVRQDGQVAATVDLEAGIRVKLDPKQTEASVSMRDVDVWLESTQARGIALAPHPDIIDPRVVEKEREPLPEPERKLRLSIDMSQPFWIKRDDMAVRLTAKLDVRVDGDGPRVKGKAVMQRGYLQLLGSLFDIDRGSSITFVEATPPDPVVELGAQMENRRSGQIIAVRITGRVSEPELVFLVDGAEVTPGEAVAAMFGEGSQDDGGAAQGQAKSMLAGVAGSMLALAARKELGAAAPIILVDPGEDASHSRVRVGFELDQLVPDFMTNVIRGVYIEGVVAGDEGTGRGVGGGVLLDLFLPASLVLTGQYGPGETWAIDFGWEP